MPTIDFSQELEDAAVTLAQKWDTIPHIHPEDFIFQFVWNHPSFASKGDAIEYYFNNGADSAEKLANLLADVCGYSEDKPCNLLEFASGYGCVTRHLEKAIPFSTVTASDIHPQAMSFISDKLKVNTVLSHHLPEDFVQNPIYDVVFALSFFSHMPKITFTRWLRQLASFVKPNGFLIFTTHGLVTRAKDAQEFLFDRDGFYFIAGSEQKDLDPVEYGSTFTMPRFVCSAIQEIPNLSLVYFQQAYWWEHQDVYIVKVMPSSLHSNSPFIDQSSIYYKPAMRLRQLWARYKS